MTQGWSLSRDQMPCPKRTRAAKAAPVTLKGLAGGTAISIVFLTNGVELAAYPAVVTWVMFLPLADANTSAGAPWVIWVARSELAAKLKTTLTPGWAASNC